MIFMLVMVGAAVVYLYLYGVTVNVSSEETAKLVRDKIVAQANSDLPRMIAEAKAEIPEIVAKEMEDQLESDRMEIAGFVFRMPDELMADLRQRLQRNVENATEKILDGIDTEVLAEQFGDNAYKMVQETMEAEFAMQSFTVMIFNRIPIDIRMQVN